MNKPMTAREFVENSSRCPKCHSENTSWGSITVEGLTTIQEASCQDCDATFYTISRLVGYGLYKRGSAECDTYTTDAEDGDSELLSAAERVLANWSSGDLAAAVRELDRVVKEVKARKADPC